jgi:ferrous iron transport protein A
MIKEIPLISLKRGQSGRIVQIEGGYGMTRRLSALGIRPGKRITKIGGMFMRGPITVKVGVSTVALGFGVASKVVVAVGK